MSDFPHDFSYDEKLILKFCHNLYKMNVKINGLHDHLLNYLSKNDKTYCASLKYWLYEEIGKMDPKGQEINENFQKLKEMLDKEYKVSYHNIDLFNEYKITECKYMDYIGKGLKVYHDTLKRYSAKTEQSKYCKDFNELNEIYKEDYIYWKTPTADYKYIYNEENTVNCALQIESLKDPLHLSYWNKKEKLHLINYPFDSQKSAVISASSAIGATAGISLFLFYLYKFTNIGSFFGHVNQKNNTMFLNMDTEPNNLTQPNSEFGNSNFESSHYDISYYLLNNS
ncbi:PIR Superfamily Protein [Plasmodium ovale wallikeri]|uniref:PIR Superfamily Protein n=1 Tax=Plasmodium ovale wallikeri TaxID=864142 RepID=A0A1A9AMD8_PLAOA|nr:PIR Superfamily Protein [Plasmodium ovale wallikeri]